MRYASSFLWSVGYRAHKIALAQSTQAHMVILVVA